jgi:dipeptidyl aminopeptidase/acylaminoacyl peptidase
LNIYVKPASGVVTERTLLVSEKQKYPHDWSADGRFLAYTQEDRKTDIWVLPLEGSREPLPIAQTAADERDPRFSPDGRWIAYTSDEQSGRKEVYVQPFPPTSGKWQVSAEGGEEPVWRGDGRELFYLSAKGLMSAEITSAPGRSIVGRQRLLFDPHLGPGVAGEQARYDVARDGQRFLLRLPVDREPIRPISILFNWPQELARRASARK